MKDKKIKVCGVLASSAEHAEITDGSIAPTLMARAGTGGNQLPLVALETIEQNSVCYGISRSAMKGGNGSNGGMPIEENIQPTLVAQGVGAVAYAVENHPNDSRARIDPDGIVQTLSSRMGTGGNNTPFVLIKNDSRSVINSSGNGIATTIDASYYKGQGLRQGIEREFVVIVDESVSG